jgi:hypothetical protein
MRLHFLVLALIVVAGGATTSGLPTAAPVEKVATATGLSSGEPLLSSEAASRHPVFDPVEN